MKRHVTWTEAAEQLVSNGWGHEAESSSDLIKTASYPEMSALLLIDIAKSLRRLNNLLSCSNFTRIPERLRLIEKNTRKVVKRRKKHA